MRKKTQQTNESIDNNHNKYLKGQTNRWNCTFSSVLRKLYGSMLNSMNAIKHLENYQCSFYNVLCWPHNITTNNYECALMCAVCASPIIKELCSFKPLNEFFFSFSYFNWTIFCALLKWRNFIFHFCTQIHWNEVYFSETDGIVFVLKRIKN